MDHFPHSPDATQPANHPPPPAQPAKSTASRKTWIIIGSIATALALVTTVAIASFQLGLSSNQRKFFPGATTYGGNQQDTFRSVTIAPDGHYIAAGSTNSDAGQIAQEHGATDALIAQIAPDGTLLGFKTFGGTGDDAFYAAAVGTDGSIVAVGYTDSTDGAAPVTHGTEGNRDALIVKLASDGAPMWANTFGGSDHDYFYSVAVARDGNIIAVGSSFSPDGDFPGTDEHAVVAKFSANGDLQWSKTYGGSEMDFFTSVALAPNGSIAVAGASRSPDPYLQTPQSTGDAFLALLSSTGEVKWAQRHGSEYGHFASVIFSGSDVIAAGALSSSATDYDASVVKLSSSGAIVWARTYGGTETDAFSSVALCKDGGVIAVGYSESKDGPFPPSAGNRDGIVVKLSSKGTMVWAQTYGDTERDEFHAVVITKSGGIVAVGNTETPVGEGQGGSTQAVVARYTSKGSLN